MIGVKWNWTEFVELLKKWESKTCFKKGRLGNFWNILEHL